MSILAMTPSVAEDSVTARVVRLGSVSAMVSGEGSGLPGVSARAWTRRPSTVSAESDHSDWVHIR